MSDEDKDSKTEDASERKLAKARQEGDTWTSREAGHTMGYLSLLVITVVIAPLTLPLGVQQISALIDLAPGIAIETPADLRSVLGGFAASVAVVMLPLLGLMFAFGLIAAMISGPFLVSLKRVQPKPSKLNPLKGLKKIYSGSNLIEFGKSLVKLLLIAVLMMWVMRQALEGMLPGAVMLPEAIVPYLAGYAAKGLMWVCLMMVPVLLFDIFWKRREWLNKQKMSKKDQRDEHKESEGDPMLRAKRREIGQRRLRQQLRKSVPEATLVVMNPTHYAVALRYERGVDVAPVCVAKGADLVALKIRDLALEHEVTVLESPPLARALHAVAELDQPIPEAHWAAVAELVSYVLDLRRRVRRKLPDGTHHITDAPTRPAAPTADRL